MFHAAKFGTSKEMVYNASCWMQLADMQQVKAIASSNKNGPRRANALSHSATGWNPAAIKLTVLPEPLICRKRDVVIVS